MDEQTDITIENHGTVMLFRVHTDEARAWVDEHVNVESWQWLGNGFAVEPRMAEALAQGMLDDGLSVA